MGLDNIYNYINGGEICKKSVKSMCFKVLKLVSSIPHRKKRNF